MKKWALGEAGRQARSIGRSSLSLPVLGDLHGQLLGFLFLVWLDRPLGFFIPFLVQFQRGIGYLVVVFYKGFLSKSKQNGASSLYSLFSLFGL
jgi:hypothetical protein